MLRKPSVLSAAGRLLAPLAALLLAAILLQGLANAYGSEFGAYPDESAHFVTGLMIRDYLASGFHEGPVHYAEQYYVHYPKVAFGMWGPLLHFTEAGWLLIFPASRVSVLILMALITALTAFFLYRAIKDDVGVPYALVAAFLFVLMPRVQTYTSMVLADGLVALLDFLAAMAFARYLDTEDWKYSVQYGLLASLAILTKGNGVSVVFIPLFAMIFAGKLRLLKRGSLYVAGIPLALIAGPWQYWSGKMLVGIADRQPGWVYLPDFTVGVVTALGIALIPVVAIGTYDRLIVKRASSSGKWPAAAALICGFWLFHCLIPSVGLESRYLIAVTPPMLMFLMAGVERLATWIPISARAWQRTAAAAIVVVAFATTGFALPHMRHYGFDEAAQALENPEYRNSVILVSSEVDGEGMLITEMAMRERRPSHYILRASKMLGQSDWMGSHYTLKYNSTADVEKFLESVPVELLVIDHGPGEGRSLRPHHEQLIETVAQYADRWERIGTFPKERNSDSQIDVYRLKSAEGRRAGKIEIDLPFTLGRSIGQ
jgi:hypothetical protein